MPIAGRLKNPGDTHGKGVAHMKTTRMMTSWRRLGTRRVGRRLRRGVAAGLALVMSLSLAGPIVTTIADAVSIGDIQAYVPLTDEQPKVTIETNGVVNAFNVPTGYVEVGIRVTTPTMTVYYQTDGTTLATDQVTPGNDTQYDPTKDKTYAQTFRYIGVSLEYNADLLTPVAWTDTTGTTSVTLSGTNVTTPDYTGVVELPSINGQNLKGRISTFAQVTGPTAATIAANTNANLTSTGLIYMVAEVVDSVPLTDELVVVVRFEYTPSAVAISDWPTSTNSMTVSGKNLLKGDPDALDGISTPNSWVTTTAADHDWLIRLAPDSAINNNNHITFVNQQIFYKSGGDDVFRTHGNEFFYNNLVAAAAAAPAGAYPATEDDESLYAEPVADATLNPLTPPDPSNATYASGYADPAFKNDLVTYIATNLLTVGSGNDVEFTFVNRESADAGAGVDMDNLTSVIYVDGGGEILGAQIVPKETDVRKLVSDYVAEHFIYHDPSNAADTLVIDPTNAATALTQMQSLDRIDNYRGKYPAAGPALDASDYSGDNTTDDYRLKDASGNRIKGSAYPLTNKLDYVFYKRPMEHDTAKPDPTSATYATGSYVSDGSQNPLYKTDLAAWERSKWVQKADPVVSTDPYYDTDYPYAYGWALCNQDNYQDTWTWMASNGELADYAIDANGFASVTYSNGADGVNFQFADLKTGLPGGTVFLKAIYEPGTDNMGIDMYRVIKSPYYTKLNSNAANGGGAYNASFTLERSNNMLADERVRGVAVVREPVVRQAVTADNLWEESVALSVNHNLPSPSLPDAQGFAKSAFIQVSVSGIDQIPVSLTFSARQNKIDWELQDKWNKNFVGGDGRTASNMSIMTSADDKGNWIPDNYNYRVDGESYTSDMWYDAPYAEREGSYGFVLFATLNAIMERATIHNHNTSETTFNQYVGINALNDINISLDGNPVNAGNIGTIRTCILAAATKAESEYANGTGDAQWWDVEHNCAQLTYHQLQDYILKGGTGSLLPDSSEAGLVAGLTWCHLHEACAALSSTKPTTWAEVIQKARSNPSDLGLLSTTEIENLTHLRADNIGTPFASPAAFQSAVQAAVAAIDTAQSDTTTIWSWDRVQSQILGEPEADAPDNYWWYLGANRVQTWADLMAATKDAVVPVTLADGFTIGTREARMNTANDAAIIPGILDNLAMSASASGTAPTANDYDTYTPYTLSDFNQLKTDLKAAYAPITGLGVLVPTWDQVQYHILKSAVLLSGADMDTFGASHFWWYKGGALVTDEASLIRADQYWRGAIPVGAATPGPREAAIMQLTSVPMYFKADFKGTAFADVTAFRNAVKDVSTTAASDWKDIQYYLIHNAYVYAEATDETGYYWWNGGATSGPGLGIVAASVDSFVEAAFAKVFNNNVNAWMDLTVAKITNAYFYKPVSEATAKSATSPYDERSDVPKFTSLSDTVVWDPSKTFTDAMEDLVTAAVAAEVADAGNPNHGHTPPTLTWYQIQKYLTDGTLVSDSAVDKDAYWWLTDNDNPNKPLTHDNFDALMAKVLAYFNSGTSVATRSDAGNIATITFAQLNLADNAFKLNGAAAFNFLNIAQGKNRLKAMINNAANNITSATDVKNLTWFQVQAALADTTNQGSIAGAMNYSWAPKWATKATDGGKATYSYYEMIPVPRVASTASTEMLAVSVASLPAPGFASVTYLDADGNPVTVQVAIEDGKIVYILPEEEEVPTIDAEASQTEPAEPASEVPEDSEAVVIPVEPVTEPAEEETTAQPVEEISDTPSEEETGEEPDDTGQTVALPDDEQIAVPTRPTTETQEPETETEIETETETVLEEAEGDDPMETNVTYAGRQVIRPPRLIARTDFFDSRGPTENRSPQVPWRVPILTFSPITEFTVRRTTA